MFRSGAFRTLLYCPTGFRRGDVALFPPACAILTKTASNQGKEGLNETYLGSGWCRGRDPDPGRSRGAFLRERQPVSSTARNQVGQSARPSREAGGTEAVAAVGWSDCVGLVHRR